jgi:hypothetical protein
MTTETPTIETVLAAAKSWIAAAELNLQRHNAGENPGDQGEAVNVLSGGKITKTEYSYADIARDEIGVAMELLQEALILKSK